MMMVNETVARGSVEELGILADYGARFALCQPGTKKPLGDGWPDLPYALPEAKAHVARGGNIGLLCGAHSDGIFALDIDVGFDELRPTLGEYATTMKVMRDNAPGRGKLLYRVDGPVESRSWKPDGERSPWAELLGEGRHALIPPSTFSDGRYTLSEQDAGIMQLTDNDLAIIWYTVTLGRPGQPADSMEPEAHGSVNGNEAVSLIKSVWTALRVFEHHGRASQGVKQEDRHGNWRILGNGGLLVKEDEWYCHSASVGGGDAISAWAYCTRGRAQVQGKEFWDVLREMADAGGVPLPSVPNHSNRSESQNGDGVGQTEDSSKPNQADLLYDLASEQADFFVGRQDGRAYAFVTVDGKRACYRVKSQDFGGWLVGQYRACYRRIPGAQAIQQAQDLLAFDARNTEQDVFLRVGGHCGKVYIDLGTKEWDAIEVDSDGWRVVATPPVAFRRTASVKPLPLPQRGANLSLVRKYLNIEPEHWPLVAAWAVAAIHGTGPYPILVLAGEQGTAKSTTLRVLKDLVDPAAAGLRGQPTETRDLMVGANNGWLLAFDNVSHLNGDLSDALCRVATGGGFAKRANYTDDEEILIDVQRPMAINGIGDIINRPDLMDRCILLCPPVIPEDKRRAESEFWQEFNQDRPMMLGALLDALSVALHNYPNTRLEQLPRMADFARLGVAAETTFGAEFSFLSAYNINREEADATVVESSAIGDHLRKLVLVSGQWEGTPTKLLEELNNRATESERRDPSWPKMANRIKGALQRLAPSLRKTGIEIDFPPRQSDGSRIRVKRLS